MEAAAFRASEVSRIRQANKEKQIEEFKKITTQRISNARRPSPLSILHKSNSSIGQMIFEVGQPQAETLSEEQLSESSTSNGLQLPEGSELALRIIRAQEEQCSAWGHLLTFVDKDDSSREPENDDDTGDEQ